MQSPIWKIVTAVGIIGIGTLVVLEVQHRLPPMNSQASLPRVGIEEPPGREVSLTPDARSEFDVMFSEEPPQDDTLAAADPTIAPLFKTPTQTPADATAFRGEKTAVHSPSETDAIAESDVSGSGVRTAAAVNESTTNDVRTATYQQNSGIDEPFPMLSITPEKPKPQTVAETGTPNSGPGFNPFTDDTTTDDSAVNIGGPKTAADIPAVDSPIALPAGGPAHAAATPKPKPGGPVLFFNGEQQGGEQRGDAVKSVSAGTQQSPMPFTDDSTTIPQPSSTEATDNSTSPFGPETFTPDEQSIPEPAAPDEKSKTNFLGDSPFGEDSLAEPFKEPQPAAPGTAPRPVPSDNGPTAQPAPADDVPYFRADEPTPTETPNSAPPFPTTDPLRPEPGRNDQLDALPFPELPASRAPRSNDRMNGDFTPLPADPPLSGNGTTPPLGDSEPFTEDPVGRPEPERDPVRPRSDIPPLDFPSLDPVPDRSAPRLTQPPSDSRETPPSADSSRATEIMRPHLTIRKVAPPSANVGVPLDYTIIVSNDGQSAAYDISVEDELSRAVELVTTKPTAELDRVTRKLTWRIEELQPSEKREILVRVTPTGEGTLNGLATVRFKTQVKAQTVITAPRLTLELTGPAEKRVGDEVALRYLIRNDGTGDASQVILRNVLPAGLRHTEGNDLEYEIDSLKRNEEREVILTVIATEKGQFTNSAEVTSAGVAAATAELKINIIGEQLKLERLGPERRYVGRAAQFQNIVSNETNFDSVNAVIREGVPEGMKFVSAQGGDYNPESRQITWKVDRLAPGRQLVFDVELTGEAAGEYDSVVEVVENAGFTTRATKSIKIEDLHNVGADVSRLNGPIPVGEKFAFSITIQNRGTAVANEVTIELEAPPEIRILAAGNKKDGIQARPVERRNAVAFDRVARIGPNESKTFDLLLQGQDAIRNGQIKARLNYAEMQEPLVVSESVTIYSEP